jgi:hypothetical protein
MPQELPFAGRVRPAAELREGLVRPRVRIGAAHTQTGAQKTYCNPSGTLGSGSDTSAF